MPRNRALCLSCGTILESKSVHDYKACPCGNFVDGGNDYWRCGGKFTQLLRLPDDFPNPRNGEVPAAVPPSLLRAVETMAERYEETIKKHQDELYELREEIRTLKPADPFADPVVRSRAEELFDRIKAIVEGRA